MALPAEGDHLDAPEQDKIMPMRRSVLAIAILLAAHLAVAAVADVVDDKALNHGGRR